MRYLVTQTRVLAILAGIFVAVVLVSLPTVPSLTGTTLIGDEKFDGIDPLEKRTTSIIIVHGIGHHCVGYADKLVSGLYERLTAEKPEQIDASYRGYIDRLQSKAKEESATHSGQVMPLRDGSCEVAELGGDVDVEGLRFDQSEDLESVVIAQDKLCKSINDDALKDNSFDGVQVSCHKLYVDRKHTKYEGESPEYITGFVRRFSADPTAGRRIRIYEVTWSPATRWIKQSLNDLERFNDSASEHSLNQFFKTEIVNAGISDAVAYLSDSGILINFNILQAFCMTLANSRSVHEDYSFACDRAHLSGGTDNFSAENDVFLISHSLGTRVLFDSIGMLALGAGNADDGEGRPRPTLVNVMASKFNEIGAVVPDAYLTSPPSEPSFAELLAKQVPEFAKAVRSIYVFTNQVPLLAANLTSPFNPTFDVGVGFQEFLELRKSEGRGDNRLQMVAFHDPDDVLSYNLSCWYYQSVLKNLAGTRELIEQEVEMRAQSADKIGEERRNLRDTLFVQNCSADGLNVKDKTLYREIWSVPQNMLKLVDADVRLKGFRVQGLAASPQAVHSNYFLDETVHSWLVDGN